MKKIFLIIFILILSLALYGFFINPKGFKITSKTIEINTIPESFNGFKILQLTDFLIKDSKDLKNIENITEKVTDLKPDIILFTGDLIYKNNNLSEQDITKLKEILSKMECTLYKYAITGDNDNNTSKDILTNSNFTILDNESKYIFYKDPKPIKITGLTNLENLDTSLTIEDNLDTALNLVITHYPDYFETLKNEDVDIILSGHSLNGQVVIPFYGGIIKSPLANKYIYGSYEENNTKLFISGGIGNKKINFRLFNKPEINLYNLKK